MARAPDEDRAASTQPRKDSVTWGPSSLQREYRKVLDLAKADAQVIIDSDGTSLVVELKSKAEFHTRLRDRMAQAGRFLAVYRANAERDPAGWANQTDFPYLAALDSDEVEEFSRELLAYTLDAAQRGTLENLEGNLRAWRSTAGIYESPEVLAQMTADLDPADIIEVFPPSEQDVPAAANG
jgi:hypothetical protein